jgi:hypothetical protein
VLANLQMMRTQNVVRSGGEKKERLMDRTVLPPCFVEYSLGWHAVLSGPFTAEKKIEGKKIFCDQS